MSYFLHDHEIPRNFQQFSCAPGVKIKSDDFTCLDKPTLIAIANYFDISVTSRMRKNTIYLKILLQLDCIQTKYAKNKQYIIQHQQKLTQCLQHHLILSDNKSLVDLINQYFRPQIPQDWHKNPHSWLSNIDIYNVLVQYQNYYKHFKFLGVFPMNFDVKYQNSHKCVYDVACQLNKQIIQNTQHKFQQFAAVFNLSYFHQKGSHWVALYICILDQQQRQVLVFYYDSCAGQMKKYILKFIQQICHFNNPQKIHSYSSPRIFLYQNKKTHQKLDTECGMFCIHFLVNLQKIVYENKQPDLIEQKYNQFIGQQNLTDHYVFQLRDYYFNK